MSKELKRTHEDETHCTGSEIIASPAKKAKRMCSYRPAGEFPWSSRAVGNKFAADCSVCGQTVSVANCGRDDLRNHAKTESHTQAVRAACSIAKTDRDLSKTDCATGITLQVCP